MFCAAFKECARWTVGQNVYMCWTAEHNVRAGRLDYRRDMTVESVEVIQGTAPQPLWFVPDLPISDVEMEAVAPSFVVVADDVDGDVRPLVPQFFGHGTCVVFWKVVLDAWPKAIHNLRSKFEAMADVLSLPPQKERMN